jgi:hypothetical protein
VAGKVLFRRRESPRSGVRGRTDQVIEMSAGRLRRLQIQGDSHKRTVPEL